MGRIRLVRGNEMFCKFSSMEVYVDESKVGFVEYLDYKDFKVKTGQHSLYIKIGGFTSSVININVDDSRPTMYSVKFPKRTLSLKELAVNIFGGKSNIEFVPMATDYRVEKYA